MRLHRVLCGCPCLQEQLQLMDAAVRAREADDHANAREDAVAREKAKRKLRMKMKRDFDRLLNNVRIGVLCACVCVCLPLSLSASLSLCLCLSVCLSFSLSPTNLFKHVSFGAFSCSAMTMLNSSGERTPMRFCTAHTRSTASSLTLHDHPDLCLCLCCLYNPPPTHTHLLLRRALWTVARGVLLFSTSGSHKGSGEENTDTHITLGVLFFSTPPPAHISCGRYDLLIIGEQQDSSSCISRGEGQKEAKCGTKQNKSKNKGTNRKDTTITIRGRTGRSRAPPAEETTPAAQAQRIG